MKNEKQKVKNTNKKLQTRSQKRALRVSKKIYPFNPNNCPSKLLPHYMSFVFRF